MLSLLSVNQHQRQLSMWFTLTRSFWKVEGFSFSLPDGPEDCPRPKVLACSRLRMRLSVILVYVKGPV